MGQKDMTEKLLEDYEDVFADILNVLLFNGEQIIQPETLKETKGNYSVGLCIPCTDREKVIQECKNPIAAGNF